MSSQSKDRFDQWFYEKELSGSRADRLNAILEPNQKDVIMKWLLASFCEGMLAERERNKNE